MSLATIAQNNDAAEVFFLIAVIIAIIAAAFYYRPLSVPNALLAIAVAFIAAGLLFL